MKNLTNPCFIRCDIFTVIINNITFKNPLINLSYVTSIDIGESKEDNKYWITFNGIDVSWRFASESDRNDQYIKILEYLTR